MTDADAEHTDGDLLEREAEALVELFNDAAADYSPDLEWFGMSFDREKGQAFVLEAEGYIDVEGLAALREAGRPVRYIEAYEGVDGELCVQINIEVTGEDTNHQSGAFVELSSREAYPIYRRKVGGKEPDGKPTRIGKWTFATKMVRDVVLDAVHGRVLNACAGETKLEKRGCEFVRNDIDESVDADTHVDVREIHHEYEPESFDSAILDPPFDPGRAAKLYEGWHGQEYSHARDAVAELVRPGGTVVELGWNSYGLGDKDGWERQAHYLFAQASFKGDVHLTVDRRVNQTRLEA